MFRIKSELDDLGRLALAGTLALAHLTIAGLLIPFIWGGEGLLGFILLGPLLGYVAPSTALMIVPGQRPD